MALSTHSEHQFHIPVMGTAFTIDTPLKVARFGVSSVVSLCDDELCEDMRTHYSKAYNLPYSPIGTDTDDYRAKRITAYLNMLDICVARQIESLKAKPFEPNSDSSRYFELLPDTAPIKKTYNTMVTMPDSREKEALQTELRNHIVPGSIDVNIMTKLDRDTYDSQAQKRDAYYADALSALRGYALSTLDSAIVFSAGFNRRLFAYINQFADFLPTQTGYLKKRVILKVSDFRSSLTQGKFLAKKGIWISEYRIESGLNCGGHAFATQGHLMGPILAEFSEKKAALAQTLLDSVNQRLAQESKPQFSQMPPQTVTVQGGIGTHHEHQFLMQEYGVSHTGWATPFLLVPEATTVDTQTLAVLKKAEKKDLYLSGISPLGVPFNTVANTQSEHQKLQRFKEGRPGSPCPKGYLVSNTEFSKKPVCTASIFYQKRKIEALKKSELSAEALGKAIKQVINKACLCEDLAAGALLDKQIESKRPLKSAVCPGPNLAYFSELFSFKEMVDHIYGRVNILNTDSRPSLFISELLMYLGYFKDEIRKRNASSTLDVTYIQTFQQNLLGGITYYLDLLPKLVLETTKYKERMKQDLESAQEELSSIVATYASFFTVATATGSQ